MVIYFGNDGRRFVYTHHDEGIVLESSQQRGEQLGTDGEGKPDKTSVELVGGYPQLVLTVQYNRSASTVFTRWIYTAQIDKTGSCTLTDYSYSFGNPTNELSFRVWVVAPVSCEIKKGRHTFPKR